MSTFQREVMALTRIQSVEQPFFSHCDITMTAPIPCCHASCHGIINTSHHSNLASRHLHCVEQLYNWQHQVRRQIFKFLNLCAWIIKVSKLLVVRCTFYDARAIKRDSMTSSDIPLWSRGYMLFIHKDDVTSKRKLRHWMLMNGRPAKIIIITFWSMDILEV